MVERLTRALLPDEQAAGWNRELFHADQLTPEALVAAGASLSLFAGRRLVLVRGVTELAAKAADRLRDALAEARRAAVGWPAEGTTVLLVAASADRKTAGLRILPESDQVEIRAPAGRAVVGWVRERARAAGLDLAPDAAQALVDLVGEDLARLAAEIEKASLYTAGDRRVSEEVVRALAGETRARQYWELTQALEEAKPSRRPASGVPAPRFGGRAAHPARMGRGAISATSGACSRPRRRAPTPARRPARSSGAGRSGPSSA